jgi:arsenate reductase-like glutaredoxin family protein
MNHPKITVYGIPNCDTVKKARQWLTEQGLAFDFHDFKKQGVPEAGLDAWLPAMGWDKLVNRQGTTWRKLDPALQSGVQDDASARPDAAAAQRDQAPRGRLGTPGPAPLHRGFQG